MRRIEVPIGATGSNVVVVTPELTVAHHHPGYPEAYATPMMIYLMEIAAGEAIAPFLPDGWASVGVAVNVRHLAPTPVGRTVTATAIVVAVDDAVVTFEVSAHDGVELIGAGAHVRAPIELGRFNARLARKSLAS